MKIKIIKIHYVYIFRKYISHFYTLKKKKNSLRIKGHMNILNCKNLHINTSSKSSNKFISVH